MHNINRSECALIANDGHQLRIWPTNSGLLRGRCYTDPTGAHMQDLLERQFQTTRSATYLRAETRFGDSPFAA